MRKYICCLITAIITMATYAQKPTGFNILANIKGLKTGSKVCMLIKKGNKIDTVGRSVVKNGVFSFKNIILPYYPDFYMVVIQDEFVENLSLFLNQKTDITLSGELTFWPNIKVTGSETHTDYLNCIKILNELQKSEFLAKYPSGIADADTIIAYTLCKYRKLIELKPQSYYVPYALVTLAHPAPAAARYGYTITPKMKKSLYDLLSPGMKASYYGRLLAKQIAEHTGN